MSQGNRVRRAGIVCCHCIRNSAYYRAGINQQDGWKGEDFWRNLNSNFLDISVLEWCKLFADKNGKHYWVKVVKDPTIFMNGLLASLNMSQIDFDAYIEKCKFYRDKFLAHLDAELDMHIPDLTVAIDSAIYLYGQLVRESPSVLIDGPSDLAAFYRERHAYAEPKYPNGT